MAGEDNLARKANYQLAGRFAPYKIKKLMYSTSIDPKWIQGTENFWYEWETSEGKTFYIVDPVRGKKEQIFDNDKIAAELTRITLDPWDAQHLPIEKIKFIGHASIGILPVAMLTGKSTRYINGVNSMNAIIDSGNNRIGIY